MIVGMAISVSVMGAWLVHRWDPGPMTAPAPWRDDLVGIAGWLYLVAFGLMLRPLFSIWNLISGILEWDAVTWHSVSDPSSAVYDALWQPGIVFELVTISAFLVLDILLLILFFSKRTSFPRMQVVYYVAWITTSITSTLLFSAIKGFDEAVLADCQADVGRSIMQSAIWVPYFLISKRVRSTFVRRRSMQPD